jgi:hypothetical protein
MYGEVFIQTSYISNSKDYLLERTKILTILDLMLKHVLKRAIQSKTIMEFDFLFKVVGNIYFGINVVT